MAISWTTDGFLNGCVQIRQPSAGFRAGSDAVLLAAAIVDTDKPLHILDVGSGVGTAGLCAKYRLPQVTLSGLELQAELVAASLENAQLNKLDTHSFFHQVNIAERSSFKDIDAPDGQAFLTFGFDHVITNPPFYESGSAQSSPNDIKSKAHLEGDADLALWLQFCIARLKPKGTLSIIHRTDRLQDILQGLSAGKCGHVRILPLWPNDQTPAKRVLVQSIKGNASPMKLLRGLVLHENNGKPTEVAEKILRNGDSLAHLFK
jgi:tRNA1(Val) A37 N6-methylase TrmN6